MKIAHLILAHKNPAQLERLLRALDHPSVHCYIHLDRKTDETPFRYLYSMPRVAPIRNRTPIHWAGWGTIQATINGFEELMDRGYDYINVISAQDYPLKTSDEFYRHILAHRGKEFITCQSIDGEWSEAAHRVRKYWLINYWRLPGRYRLEQLVNLVLPKRKFPLDHQIVGRANWFTLTNDAVRYSMEQLRQHPELIRYYKYCWGADEFVFSTILYNSAFRSRLIDNLVYVDWSGPKTGHPKILTIADLSALQASDKFFARKFDSTVDSEVLDRLEEAILRHQLTT